MGEFEELIGTDEAAELRSCLNPAWAGQGRSSGSCDVVVAKNTGESLLRPVFKLFEVR
jgi:hypothetical protein